YANTGAGYDFYGSLPNRVSANFGTIGGGWTNTIETNAFAASIGGGEFNVIQADAGKATIGGGSQNAIQTNAAGSTIAGGFRNTIEVNALNSAIGGGSGNTNNGKFAIVDSVWKDIPLDACCVKGSR